MKTDAENNLLEKGSFLGTKSGTLLLVYSEEWVGEQEEEHVAIVASIAPASENVAFKIIPYEDPKFNEAKERGSIFRCSRWGKLRKYYKKMKKVLGKKSPNYSSILLSNGEEFE